MELQPDPASVAEHQETIPGCQHTRGYKDSVVACTEHDAEALARVVVLSVVPQH